MKLLKTIVLAIAAAFIIQGCSEKGVSMEEIPATADYVAVINADSIPDALSTLLIPAETPAQTGSLAESCDLVPTPSACLSITNCLRTRTIWG